MDDRTVLSTCQDVSGSDHGDGVRLKELSHSRVEVGQVLHDLLAGVQGWRIRSPDVGTVLHADAA